MEQFDFKLPILVNTKDYIIAKNEIERHPGYHSIRIVSINGDFFRSDRSIFKDEISGLYYFKSSYSAPVLLDDDMQNFLNQYRYINNDVSSKWDDEIVALMRKVEYAYYLLCPYTNEVTFKGGVNIYSEMKKKKFKLNGDEFVLEFEVLGNFNNLEEDNERELITFIKNLELDRLMSSHVMELLKFEWSQEVTDYTTDNDKVLEDYVENVKYIYSGNESIQLKRTYVNFTKNFRYIKAKGKMIVVDSPIIENFNEKLNYICKYGSNSYYNKYVKEREEKAAQKLLDLIKIELSKTDKATKILKDIKKIINED